MHPLLYAAAAALVALAVLAWSHFATASPSALAVGPPSTLAVGPFVEP